MDLKRASGCGLRQKDPLIEYKREGFQMFMAMNGASGRRRWKSSSMSARSRPDEESALRLRGQEERRLLHVRARAVRTHAGNGHEPRECRRGCARDGPGNMPSGRRRRREKDPITVNSEGGPDDPCPCGSGKKYKNAMEQGQ